MSRFTEKIFYFFLKRKYKHDTSIEKKGEKERERETEIVNGVLFEEITQLVIKKVANFPHLFRHLKVNGKVRYKDIFFLEKL